MVCKIDKYNSIIDDDNIKPQWFLLSLFYLLLGSSKIKTSRGIEDLLYHQKISLSQQKYHNRISIAAWNYEIHQMSPSPFPSNNLLFLNSMISANHDKVEEHFMVKSL